MQKPVAAPGVPPIGPLRISDIKSRRACRRQKWFEPAVGHLRDRGPAQYVRRCYLSGFAGGKRFTTPISIGVFRFPPLTVRRIFRSVPSHSCPGTKRSSNRIVKVGFSNGGHHAPPRSRSMEISICSVRSRRTRIRIASLGFQSVTARLPVPLSARKPATIVASRAPVMSTQSSSG